VAEPALQIEDLHISFFTLAGEVRAINGVSLEVYPGEFFGLVGETGCGKTVTGLAVLGLVPKPGRVTQGRILLHGRDLLRLSAREMRRVRGGDVAMIFQNPTTSLNPVFTIGNQLVRVIRLHQKLSRREAKRRACELLEMVGLPEAERLLEQYPHQLSGGMLQRVMIAMALSSHPSLLIADEPTTALDVTIQAQILAILRDLQARLGITTLFITHDLAIIAETCDRVAVLYAGQVVDIPTPRASSALSPAPTEMWRNWPLSRARSPPTRASSITAFSPPVAHMPGTGAGPNSRPSSRWGRCTGSLASCTTPRR
jgi:ABC-type dipeptide/oligopeptide/nickel transport system ATPase component